MCASPVDIVSLSLRLMINRIEENFYEKCIFVGIFFHKIIFLTTSFPQLCEQKLILKRLVT